VESKEEPKPFAPAPLPEATVSSRADLQRGAEPSAAGAVAPRPAEERSARDAAAAPRALQSAPTQALAKRAEVGAAAPAAESPERELERIAELRRDGRHEEADRALAEFRKRHPDYKIPEKTLERVERR
jgi:hypothetical protein